ncbi:MAG: hypothetical protein R3264_06775, partial [Anaerolineae bacterium]|nr:hypothetical protein [Anaerolineae bacterium]
VSDPDNQKGYLPGAFEQLATAESHTGFLEESLAGDDLNGARRHAEHVVNILEGKEGEHYGDLDGSGLDENPGDGFGVRNYLISAVEATQRATEAATVSANTPILAEQIRNNGDTTLTTLDNAIEKTLQIFAADTVEEAVTFRDELRSLLEQVRSGTDLDNNGAIDPTKNEGGLIHLYQDSLRLGEIPIFPVE